MNRKKILVVEDDREIAGLIAFHMGITGFEVLSAKDGIEALEVCKLHKPDLIILDILLPRMNGWQICKYLKQTPQTRDIPIIIISALSDISDKLKGFDLGSDDYLTKPFSPRELVARVKRILVFKGTVPGSEVGQTAGEEGHRLET